MRRLSFQSQMPAAVDGFGEWDLDAFLWGEWHSEELGDLAVERPPIAVVGPLRRRAVALGEEFAYARGRTDRVLKVTLPSPSLFANFYDPERSREAYPTLEDFLADVAEILREEVDELVELGATYIQLDARTTRCSWTTGYRAFYESRGWPADRWLDFGIELDNLVMGDHPGVTFGFHLCRGNQASRWLVAGGYDWLAERLFPGSGSAPPARVRRRALRRLRAAGARARRRDLRARARDDEDVEARDGRASWRPGSGGCRVVPLDGSPSRRSAASRPRSWATRSRRGRAGEARDDRRDGRGGLGLTRSSSTAAASRSRRSSRSRARARRRARLRRPSSACARRRALSSSGCSSGATPSTG